MAVFIVASVLIGTILAVGLALLSDLEREEQAVQGTVTVGRLVGSTARPEMSAAGPATSAGWPLGGQPEARTPPVAATTGTERVRAPRPSAGLEGIGL